MNNARSDHGQMHTIEAVAAAFIMIAVLAIVVETTSLTPLSSSFTSQHIKLELQNMGSDVLRALDETPVMNTTDMNQTSITMPSMLQKSVIDWSVYSYYDTYSWNGTAFISLYNGSCLVLDTPLTNALAFAMLKNGTACNVEVCYPDLNGNLRTSKMIWNGDPSENSVTVSRYIALYDTSSQIPVGTRFDSVDNVVMPDISAGPLHSVVEVRLTMWVM